MTGSDAQFPFEMASETMARLYETQGRPDKAAAIRALIGKAAHVEARVCDGAIEVSWHAAEAGPVLLRLVVFAPGGGPLVTDTPAPAPSGTTLLRADPGWACVAIGRHDGERFVPLAHAPPLCVVGI